MSLTFLCGWPPGLINQHACHYTALAISVALGAKRLVQMSCCMC